MTKKYVDKEGVESYLLDRGLLLCAVKNALKQNTVEGVTEIIRCADCAWFDKEKEHCNNGFGLRLAFPNSFCVHAERIGDDELSGQTRLL